MKRRDFVKSLTAAQLAMMMPSLRATETLPLPLEAETRTLVDPPYSAINRLNVVVHGMFVIVINKSGVSLSAPKVDGACPHVYRAQAFLPDKSDQTNVVEAWGQPDYDVATPNTTDAVNFTRSSGSSLSVVTGEDERLAIYIGQKKQKTPYWTVVLPLPDNLWPLREAPFNYFDGRSYINAVFNATYINNGMRFGQKPPMVYVLSYTKIASDKIVFSGNNKEVPIDDDGIGRLHFYAEPEKDCTDYAHTALNALDDMFDSKLTLQFDSQLPDPDEALGRDGKIRSDFVGVRLAEERSLSERTSFPNSQAFQKNVALITQQYSKFYAYMDSLKAREDRRQAALAPGDLKPPSNCMSIIGTTS